MHIASLPVAEGVLRRLGDSLRTSAVNKEIAGVAKGAILIREDDDVVVEHGKEICTATLIANDDGVAPKRQHFRE